MYLLQEFKNKLNTGKSINGQKLFYMIDKCDVVSFDIFDTLLKRNVLNPRDVFFYMEKKYDIPGFTEKRIEAEKRARVKLKGTEITLADIYDEYGEDLTEKELKTESELLRCNNDMLSIFKKCIESKRVILTSDMYLPESFIVRILDREGIVGYNKLYISSSIKKTKNSGELFEYIIEDQNVDKRKIIHIGDSMHSDYIIPRKIGLHAIHIPKNIPKAKFQLKKGGIEQNIINAFLNNTSFAESDDYYRFGYERFGMFLWGYSKWLHESLVTEGIKEVYFFSRDGLIMKKAFDILYNDVNTYYLEVSRRALRVPVLWMNYEFEHVIDMISPSKLVSLATIFDGIGLEIREYVELINEYGFNMSTSFDRNDLINNSDLKQLYDQLGSEIEKNSKKEYDLLVKYIRQKNLKGKFAIVDIGWSGGMQRYLEEVLTKLEIEHSIKGYYIGVADYYKRNTDVMPTLDLNGYLFDFFHDNKAIDRRSAFVGLFESLFLEQEGSVKNYIEENGIMRANRLPYEYLENNQPTYEFECIKKVQNGALDFVRKFGVSNIYLPADVLFSGLESVGLRPNRKDLRMFADFRFFDEGLTLYLAKPKKLNEYIFNIKMLKDDFLLSRWKVGFMKRLVKLALPYEKIYKSLLKFK